jgi:hypothetical protein
LQVVEGESQIYDAVISSSIAISKITHIPMSYYHFPTEGENVGKIAEKWVLKNRNS